ncbi:hypothetical protein GSF22_33910, partial [Micromonospora echinofusca]|nr:hypothetical protein [Micromonospora echinofusca]
AWATVPVLGLYAAAQVTPLFLPRYLLFTLPAWALLAGIALGRVHVGLTVGTLAVVVALAVPQQLAIREPDGHSEAGHQLAALIADGYRTGDGIVYGTADPGGSWVARDTVEHYVPVDRRPLDLLATRPQRTGGQLAATECTDTARCLGEPARLWIVRLGYHGDALSGLGDQKEPLLRQHYLTGQTWHLPGFTLALVTRRPS